MSMTTTSTCDTCGADITSKHAWYQVTRSFINTWPGESGQSNSTTVMLCVDCYVGRSEELDAALAPCSSVTERAKL